LARELTYHQSKARTINMAAETAPLATDVLPKADETPLSPIESGQKLEKLLKNRSDRDELVDRNVLKSVNLAPALAAQKEQLERSMLENKLGDALSKRPPPSELVKEGILQENEAPPEVSTDRLQGDKPSVSSAAA